MLEFEKALELIVSAARVLPSEKVSLGDAVMRVLASDIVSDMEMPPFSKSAMDGYACRSLDLGNPLEVIEVINAGKRPEKPVGKNQCSKIMTGAMVPVGADFVFKKEDAGEVQENRVMCMNPSAGNHVVGKGSDIRQGEKVLSGSTLILPRHLPVMAGAGVTEPDVFCRPRVAVLATGTELVGPEEKPLPFQIRNTNSVQILAQLAALRIGATYGGIAMDEKSSLTEKFNELFTYCDVLLVTGGVSVGDFDFVPEILTGLGFDSIVSSTAIKPGKPMVFAVKDRKYCFGLSGNPVSSYIQFELYVKPFLYALMGHRFIHPVLKLLLDRDISINASDRLNFVPAIVSAGGEVVDVEFHGSAHSHALTHATHLLEVPAGTVKIKKGETVNVRPL